MTAVLIDSNVLLDVMTGDPHWSSWSSAMIAAATDAGRVVINPIVYAEVSVRYTRMDELDRALPTVLLDREPIPYEAAFLAGKCFKIYRSRGGARRSPLPDFFIGAHAAIAGYHVLTRDPARYRGYFPDLPLLTPDLG